MEKSKEATLLDDELARIKKADARDVYKRQHKD